MSYKYTPVTLAFNGSGELFAAYRDQGPKHTSSSIWIRVYDPKNGNELRRGQIPTQTVPLVNGAQDFYVSSDDSFLLYAQFWKSTQIMTIDARTLQKKSVLYQLPDDRANNYPYGRVLSDNRTVRILSYQYISPTQQILDWIDLDKDDLSHVLGSRSIKKPYEYSSTVFDSEGKIQYFLCYDVYLYRYDTENMREISRISTPSINKLVYIGPTMLLLYKDNHDSGMLYRFNPVTATVEKSQMVEKAGVLSVTLTPDRKYGVAMCQNRPEDWWEGSVSFAVSFDVNTLRILGRLPLEKDFVSARVAIGNRDGKVYVATQNRSGDLEVYEFEGK